MTVNVNLLDPFFRRLEQISTWRSTGRVKKAVGFLIESEGPYCSVGECCAIVGADGREHPGEVVGFRGSTVLSMPLDRLDGLRFGDRVITHGARPSLPMGPDLLGRVIDGSGNHSTRSAAIAPRNTARSTHVRHSRLIGP